jgi:hypothetical protein
MPSRIAATALLEPMLRKPIPKAPARFAARAARALFRFPTRTVRKPPEVVTLATIEPSRTGETCVHAHLARLVVRSSRERRACFRTCRFEGYHAREKAALKHSRTA